MKKGTKNIALVFSFLVTFLLGVWYGFWQGSRVGVALDSMAFAAISTGQIERLDSNKEKDIAFVKRLLDDYVTSGISQYIWYQEHANEYLMLMYYPEYKDTIDTSINYIVKYRQKHPEKDLSQYVTNKNDKTDYINAFNQRAEVVKKLTTN